MLRIQISQWILVSLTLLGLFGLTTVQARAEAGALSSDWVDGHASRVRLIAGRQAVSDKDIAQGDIVAGVEIELDDGWKTYWRNPGEAGGVPPEFDFSKSSNVASAKVLYPAPKRLTDKTGDTIGYKHRVVFPVVLKPANTSENVDVKLEFAFGVCADICIPAEASMQLLVPANVSEKVPAEVSEALAHIPRGEDARSEGDPKLASYKAEFEGQSPQVVIDVEFPGGAEKGDLFVTAPAGIYMPMARRSKASGLGEQTARFVVDLREAFDLEELKGQTVTLTMVGAKGQSQHDVVLK